MWRITDDFWDDWRLLKAMFERCEVWQSHVSEGCFPDCDMLPVGYLGQGFGGERYSNFSNDELHTMMSLWCIFRSPLMIGGELTRNDEQTLSLLTNEEVLHLVKHSHGARQIARDSNHAIWFSYDDEDRIYYLGIFNLSEEEREQSVLLEDINLNEKVQMRDLWKHKDLGVVEHEIVVKIPAHGAILYKLSK